MTLTTSGTYDPAEHTVVPPPQMGTRFWLARPELDPNVDKSARTASARAYCRLKTASDAGHPRTGRVR